MIFIYILLLEGNNYYVGKTTNIEQRMKDYESGKFPAWVKVHAYQKLIAVIRCLHNEDQNKWVKIMMKHFGIERVRGGAYCQLNLSQATKYFLQIEIWHNQDKCLGCGKYDHWIPSCSKRSQLQRFNDEQQLLKMLEQQKHKVVEDDDGNKVLRYNQPEELMSLSQEYNYKVFFNKLGLVLMNKQQEEIKKDGQQIKSKKQQLIIDDEDDDDVIEISKKKFTENIQKCNKKIRKDKKHRPDNSFSENQYFEQSQSKQKGQEPQIEFPDFSKP